MENENLNNRQVDIGYYEPIYTIGIAADRIGVSVHTLRQYETEGLILSHKTSTGRRIYSEMELDKVRCIKNMVSEQGLNFEGVRQLLSLIPCWKIRDCCDNEDEECKSFTKRKTPCWSSEEKCKYPYPDCRDCEVYRNLISCDDLKKYIYK
ncbi:MAG: MerR family transcriptional regulator [Acidobacteriota bacterium]